MYSIIISGALQGVSAYLVSVEADVAQGLAAFMQEKAADETLPDYLTNRIFAGQTGTTIAPKAEDVAGFDAFVEKYKSTLIAEKAAVEGLR